MREKLLQIAKRIEEVENECNVDLLRPREILRAVREAIEEELAEPTAVWACIGCGAKVSSDGSWSELHQGHCPYR